MQRKFDMRKQRAVFSAFEQRMLDSCLPRSAMRKELLTAMALGYHATEYSAGATMRVATCERNGFPSTGVEVYTTKTDDDMRYGPSWHRLELTDDDWRKIYNKRVFHSATLYAFDEGSKSRIGVPSPGTREQWFVVDHTRPETYYRAFIWRALGILVEA